MNTQRIAHSHIMKNIYNVCVKLNNLSKYKYRYREFGLQILIFSDTAKCWREGCSEGWFWPPPFTPRSD